MTQKFIPPGPRVCLCGERKNLTVYKREWVCAECLNQEPDEEYLREERYRAMFGASNHAQAIGAIETHPGLTHEERRRSAAAVGKIMPPRRDILFGKVVQ